MDKIAIQSIYAIAGPDLAKTLESYFGDQEDGLIKWFETRNPVLDYLTPREYCEAGNAKYLDSLLISLAQGNIGL